ncbi:crotonase/enoyl-CoA hydratase family protein [Denitromonas ohlonensis]|uniref:Crotonase/enoyl-CoA hydratase family protein n=2 Tax=Denitromonas TaxID=139331 RepID=A0A557RSB7_9RHOO|nr:crotonase/enoyl-CoA hydratase family protein [Denitromonas ohlonensis]TVO68068.1 crotonase/enoyl-CoA hydratase family protein [Denitromonas ohlonensis]TVO78027.1 crotonase/enoyl-CoA hydratase family protein [Denitromonas ohlonensis]
MTNPDFANLSLSLDNGIARIAFNRPDCANALDAELWDAMRRAFQWADDTDAVRVVVLAGEGKHFCAGIDLALLAGVPARIRHADPARAQEKLRRLILDMQDCVSAIARCRKPVIAAIQGACIGGGVDIVTACDMRYASAEARFSVREIDMAMAADVGTLQRLPRLIPDGIARELAFTGREFGATEAAQLGLVNRVFDTPEALSAGVEKIAQAITGKSPLAIRGTKAVMDYSRDHSIEDGLRFVANWNASALLTRDMQVAAQAMQTRQAPPFDD